MQRTQNYGFVFADGREHNVTLDLDSLVALQVVEGTKRIDHCLYLKCQDWIQVESSDHNDMEMSRLYRHWQDWKNSQ